MTKFGLLSTSAIGSAALCAFAAPAQAEDAVASQPTCTPEQAAAGTCTLPVDATTGAASESGPIVVTGSRIRRPNLESTVPITSLAGEQIFQQSDTNVGETLNDLPQLRSTFAQSNPGSGIGISGLNLLDLRGLGTQRTLVLVNGRRHVPSDILNNAVSVDVNTIPADLIERIDIVTGGNSAIYGSDAIAGVVNFILRRDFEGLRVRGQAAIADDGFGANQYVSAMYGMNFADGRGNVTLHGEFYRAERIYASDVPEYRLQNGLFTVDADSGGLPNNSDGFPDRVFFRDVRSATINPNGLVPISQPTVNPQCGVGTLANNGGPNNLGTPYNCTYLWTPDGRLVQQTGALFGTGQLGSRAGGNGQTGREGNTVTILPSLERYNFNFLAHYSFSEAFELFTEAKWTRTHSVGRNAGPSFIQGQTTQFDQRERPRLDNPFILPGDRTTLTNLILASGLNPRLAARTPLGTAGLGLCTAATVTAGTCRFDLARNLLDVGLRDETFTRDTWRVVGGLRGTFNDDWSYEVSVNYGKFTEDTTVAGFIDRQRFSLSMDAGRNPVTGAIQCRSQFDPASAVIFDGPGYGTGARTTASMAGRLASDIAACVPYNPFGAPNNTAAVNYFTHPATTTASLDQLVLSGFVSGDSSQIFELPGGPIRFALGAEYRRERAFFTQDPFVQEGNTNNVAIPTFAPGSFRVKEAFAEIQIPLLKDMPFFHELTLSGAARVAGYQGGVGTVWAYNAGMDWAPIRDIRFRGNYSRAVRAPNVSETAFPLVPNFANNFTDPCNPAARNSGANRATNCAADLGALLPNLTDVVQSLAIVSGSNPNLTAETSDSWSVGAVIQPRFIPGMSLSADYYNIKVDGVIASVTAQQIVNSCYDSATLNNIFCQQFTRFRGPGAGPNGEIAGRILGNSLIVAPLNYASRERAGIDFNFNYRTNISSDVRIDTSVIYSHNLTTSNFQDPTNPTFENRILGELGDPKDEFRWDTDFTYGAFTLGYRLRYIGPMWTNTFENFNELNTGQPGATPPGGDDADWSEPRKYPAVTYSDLRFEWNILGGDARNVGHELRLYFGVDNIFNQMPPLGATATGVGSAIYEYRGRSFYGGFRARF
jgi:outer membrane receptor protein involved in Fe transport